MLIAETFSEILSATPPRIVKRITSQFGLAHVGSQAEELRQATVYRNYFEGLSITQPQVVEHTSISRPRK